MNSATLNNFNFTADSGWTGKGLKFDGVDDQGVIKIPNIVDFLKGDFTIETTFLTPRPNQNKYRVSLAIYNNMITCSPEGQLVQINKISTKPVPNFIDVKTVNTFVKSGNTIKYYQNAVLKQTTELIDWDLNVDTGSVSECNKITIGTTGLDSFDRISGVLKFSDIFYNRALTNEEIQQNYEYEQSIDRTTLMMLPVLQEEKSYGIGLASQLSEEQLKTFRLSVDKTKFVAGLNYCEGLTVDKYTYSKTLEIMETEDWKSEESYIS